MCMCVECWLWRCSMVLLVNFVCRALRSADMHVTKCIIFFNVILNDNNCVTLCNSTLERRWPIFFFFAFLLYSLADKISDLIRLRICRCAQGKQFIAFAFFFNFSSSLNTELFSSLFHTHLIFRWIQFGKSTDLSLAKV